jgi:polysaccharide biosynthesis transport protein
MPPDGSPASSLSLGAYLAVLRRQWRLIAAVTVLTAAFAALPSVLADAEYSSTARVRVSALDEEGVFQTDSSGQSLPSDRLRELLTEVEIIRSMPLRAAVVATFEGDPPAFGGPSVEPVGFSEIITITVTAADPATAADVANAYAEVFVADRRERSVEALVAKASELRNQSAEAAAELASIGEQLRAEGLPASTAASLQAREVTLTAQVRDFNRLADELDVEASLRGRGTQLISPAPLRLSPISSGPARPAVLGAALGLLLGVSLAVVLDLVRDRIGSRDDLSGVQPGVPVLASVPHTDRDPAGSQSGFAVKEAFRYLRTGVRIFGLNAQLRSVIVTSAMGGEGKTTTATNLARAMAEAGDRVVLVDCDLRRPTLHERFGLPNHRGLSSMVVGDASSTDAVHFVEDNLAVITAGPAVQNPTELLGSEQFGRVLRSIVAQADFTILDSPPVLPVADALISGQHVDGAIAVGRVGLVRRRAVRELIGRLEEAGIPLVGLVANDTDELAPGGYYDSRAPAEPAGTA